MARYNMAYGIWYVQYGMMWGVVYGMVQYSTVEYGTYWYGMEVFRFW